MLQQKNIGWLLLLGTIAVIVPYAILTSQFHYPDILRAATGAILTSFHAGGTSLIITWLFFALSGLPLVIAVSMIGQYVQPQQKWVTQIGLMGLWVQMIGLLRWVFVVPVLATHYVSGDAITKTAIEQVFIAIHQFGGVLLGEHLGQLLTIIWTVFTIRNFSKSGLMPTWLSTMGYFGAFIYLCAQAELLATVIPNFPQLPFAGLMGSTIWLVWLLVVAIRLIRQKQQ